MLDPVAFMSPNANSSTSAPVGRGLPGFVRLAAWKSLRSLKSSWFAQNWRIGSSVAWQPTHSVPATAWLASSPAAENGMIVFSAVNACPSATSKVGKAGKKAPATTKSPSPAREWQTNVADRDSADFVPYSIDKTFEPGQLVSHPKFGSGYVKEALASQKLCVLFKDGPRTLVHGRT